MKLSFAKSGLMVAAAALVSLSLSATAVAQEVVERTSAGRLVASVHATGLSHPWGVAVLPDGALLVTERGGAMRVIRDGVSSDPLPGLPDIAVGGQGGLLDVALPDDFSQTGEVYFTFSEPGRGGAGTALGKARLEGWEGASPRLSGTQTIFTMNRKSRAGRHYGSRIVFAADGTIFVTTGDRGDADRAQDMGDHAGAVIRINRDGSVPADNPFIGRSGVAPELWSKGHRNAQGADLHPQTGALWTVEHGARGGDEINQPKPGLNYGWPEISYGRHYSGLKIGQGTQAQGFEQPVYYWDPSIAPSGLVVYDGAMFEEWQGDLLVGALKDQKLVRLDLDDNGKVRRDEILFERDFGRVRDIEIAPDGSLYLLIDDDPGSVIHIRQATS